MRGVYDLDTMQVLMAPSRRKGAQITVSLPHDDLEAIDRLRGEQPRSQFIVESCLSGGGSIPRNLAEAIKKEAEKAGYTAEQLMAIWLDKHRRGE